MGERAAGEGPPVVLLHSGVSDRRSWGGVIARLEAPAVAYDRRGFGETPPAVGPFSHLEDLLAVLDATVEGPAWLVGNSKGGGLALEAALEHPERVAGLVLIAPAVGGVPEEAWGELDAATAELETRLAAARDVEEQARLEALLWLDGPAGPEDRVGGATRELALGMNRRILAGGGSEEAGESGVDAWSRLGELRMPVTLAVCELDVPALNRMCRAAAQRIPAADVVELPGVAHLPGLEAPEAVAELVRGALRRAGAPGSA